MERITTTPFGQRPVTADLIAQVQAASAEASVPHINKWELFRELCAARNAFDVSDRDLTVLNALLSFHQDAALSDNASLIVFPSNRALSERAHGMAESTLRRHLAALVDAGLILRHDSPNGKRYARRDAEGCVARAFGLDLRPLLLRAREITLAAAEIRAAADRLKRLREDVSLMKRDALKLVVYGQDAGFSGDWSAMEAELLSVHKALRRNLTFAEVQDLHRALTDLLQRIGLALSMKSEEMDGSDADIERHYQNSNEDSHESEPCQETGKGGEASTDPEPEPTAEGQGPRLPLALVLKACPDILPYASGEVRHWHELVATAGFVRGMMGISPDAWQQAQVAMGRETAAITVACILQRIAEINSPGGYLRALTRKAEEAAFSPGPMVMALLNTSTKSAA